MLDCYFVCVYVVVHSRRGKGVRIHSRSPAWISWERGSEGACSRQEKNKEQDQSTGATRFAPKPYPLAPLPVISSSLNCCPVRSCVPGLLVSCCTALLPASTFLQTRQQSASCVSPTLLTISLGKHTNPHGEFVNRQSQQAHLSSVKYSFMCTNNQHLTCTPFA